VIRKRLYIHTIILKISLLTLKVLLFKNAKHFDFDFTFAQNLLVVLIILK